MSLKRLINQNIDKSTKELEKAREEFIKGAGLVASDITETKSEWINIKLRIKADAIERIDSLLNETMGLTRTGWILQAIEEKLKK